MRIEDVRAEERPRVAAELVEHPAEPPDREQRVAEIRHRVHPLQLREEQHGGESADSRRGARPAMRHVTRAGSGATRIRARGRRRDRGAARKRRRVRRAAACGDRSRRASATTASAARRRAIGASRGESRAPPEPDATRPPVSAIDRGQRRRARAPASRGRVAAPGSLHGDHSHHAKIRGRNPWILLAIASRARAPRRECAAAAGRQTRAIAAPPAIGACASSAKPSELADDADVVRMAEEAVRPSSVRDATPGGTSTRNVHRSPSVAIAQYLSALAATKTAAPAMRDRRAHHCPATTPRATIARKQPG